MTTTTALDVPPVGTYVDETHGHYTSALALTVARDLGAPIAAADLEAAATYLDPAAVITDETAAAVADALEAAESWLTEHRAYERTSWGPCPFGVAGWGHHVHDVEPAAIRWTARILDHDADTDADLEVADGFYHPSARWDILEPAEAPDPTEVDYLDALGLDYTPDAYARAVLEAVTREVGSLDHAADNGGGRIDAYAADPDTDYRGTYGAPLARYQALRAAHVHGLTDQEAAAFLEHATTYR